jgi:AraC-like DNA-binding protein
MERVRVMKSGIYRKIVVSFFIVIIIYTILVGTLIVRNTVSKREMEWEASSRYFLEQTTNTVDDQLISAINMSQVLLDSTSVQQLIASQGETDYTIYSSVYDDIVKQQYFESNYFVGITPQYAQNVISSNGYFNFEDYLKLLNLGAQSDNIKKFFQSTDTSEVGLFESKNFLTLIQDIKHDGKDLFFFATWDKASIWPQNFPDKHSNFIMVDASHLTSNSSIAVDFPKAIKLANQGFSDAINMDSVSKNDNQVGYFKKSAVIPTFVYGYTSNLNFRKGLPLSILLPLIGYFVILLGLGATLMLYFSRKNYKPYKQIISEIPSSNPKMDVNDLLDNIHLLVEENDHLSQFQSEISGEVKESFFKKLLSETYSTKELQKLLEIIQLDDLSEGGIIAILTLTSTTHGLPDENEVAYRLLKDKVPNILLELNAKFKEDVVLSLNPLQYVLVIPKYAAETTRSKFNDVSEYLMDHFFVKVRFTLSLPFKDLYHFQEIFSDAYKVAKEENFTEISLTKQSEIQYPIEIESMIIQNAKSGNFSECENLIKRVLFENLLDQKVSLSLLYEVKFLMLNTIKRILGSLGTISNQFFELYSEQIKQISESTDPKYVNQLFNDLFSEMFAYIKQNKRSQVKMDKQVIDFINGHYAEDISLGYVADKFSLSESYLSKVIKNYLGISFKTYLNNLRILESKELLKGGHLKVAEIANKVGFGNVNTFIRVFKHAEGVTPGKYQQMNVKQK